MVGVPKVTTEALPHEIRDAAGTMGGPLHHRRCRRRLQAAGCRRASPWRTIALQPVRERGIPIRNELY
ncbi:hypothetical protein NL30_11150 [Burkholderia contaminans]|nr:hypothetical protein NL30_11150 [Burkholderia contaminans]